jgi:hypothetical protein
MSLYHVWTLIYSVKPFNTDRLVKTLKGKRLHRVNVDKGGCHAWTSVGVLNSIYVTILSILHDLSTILIICI